MVVRQVNSKTGETQIIVRGNRSMSWRANVMLAASLGVVSMMFSIGIAWFGFWLVLPFAGLEFALVLYCLSATYRRLGFMEVISVGDSTVVVEKGYDKPEKTVELLRAWIRLQFDDPPSCFDVGKLQLKAAGQLHEIGRSLSKEDKRLLHRELSFCLDKDEPRLQLIS